MSASPLAEPPPASSTPAAALRYPDVRWFLSARLMSVLSSEMVSVAVAWQVYDITGSLLALGYVGLAQFLPSFLLFLVAGHTIDRVDRRRILLAVQASYACTAVLLWHLSRYGHPGMAPIYAILVVIGTIRAFGGPAGQALMPQLVPNEQFANAVTWGSTTFMAATIIGPAIGGLLYGWVRPGPVYLAAAVGYAGAVAFTAAIATRTGRMESRDISLETLLEGFRYVRANRIILGSITLDLFAVLLGGAVALLPYFARNILHTGPLGLGLLRSASSVGALLMAVALAFHPLRRRVGRTMLACVALFGLATIGFGLSRSFALSMVLLAVVGASDMVSVVVRQTLVQLETPARMRGRVSAINMLFIGTSNQFGEFESGVTGAWWGAVPATVIGGVGTLVVVALWWRWFPALRQVEQLTLREPAVPVATGATP